MLTRSARQVEFVYDREIVEVYDCNMSLCHRSVCTHMFSAFEHTILTTRFEWLIQTSYAFQHLKHIKEALSSSSKTVSAVPARLYALTAMLIGLNYGVLVLQSIRTDETGLLSLQFMMPLKQAKSTTTTNYSRRDVVENGFVEILVCLRARC